MIVATTDIPNGQNVEILGVVRGNIATSRHIGKDILAGFRNVVGGEVKQYTEMTTSARDEAERRLVEHAEELGADAVYGARFATSVVAEGTIEILAFGTAVKFN